MSDIGRFAVSGPGRALMRALGLPVPSRLRRFAAGEPLVPGPVLVGGDGRLGASLDKVLAAMGVELRDPAATGTAGNAVLIFDATGVTDTDKLGQLYEFFHPQMRDLHPSGRIVVLGTRPAECTSTAESVAQRALEGFVRSIGKELTRGATTNLVYASGDADLESVLRFLLSAKSAYVCGQVLQVGPAPGGVRTDWTKPLEEKVARRPWHATARTSSASTCPPPGKRFPMWRTTPTVRRTSWTSPPRTRRTGSPSSSKPGTAAWTSSCTTPASPAIARWPG